MKRVAKLVALGALLAATLGACGKDAADEGPTVDGLELYPRSEW
jgi:hypothetical protein